MKKILNVFFLSIVLVLMLEMNVYGFENETYKIDIPSDYQELSSRGTAVFAKTDHTGITIFSIESSGLKKDINTMSQSEINEILNKLFGYKTQVLSKGKEKLGKSKAIKARVKSEDSYMDTYIVVSDKHVLLIAFIAKDELTLDSQEFASIKKSFKMKEKTTNVTLLRGGMVFLAIGGTVVRYIKKRRK